MEIHNQLLFIDSAQDDFINYCRKSVDNLYNPAALCKKFLEVAVIKNI